LRGRVHILLGPPGSGKTARLHSQAGGNAFWVVPTDRHRHDVVTLQPGTNATTLPGLARRLAFSGDSVIPESHQRLLLGQVLESLRPRLKTLGLLVGLPGFTDTVFAFLSQVKGQGASPGEFRAFARETSDGEDARDREVALVYATYQRLLSDHDWLDRDAVYRRAAERLANRPAVDPSTVILIDGFTDFTPPQLAMLQGLAGCVTELWITLLADNPGDDERSELFAVTSGTAAELARKFPYAEFEHLPITSPKRPAAIAQIEQQLFRDTITTGCEPEGLRLIEAPGLVGEVRLVARAVKELLLGGVEPGRILVCARDLRASSRLIEEIFGAYAIPLNDDSGPPLARVSEVRALLAAARLPDDGWPFAATAAFLRNTLVRLAETPADELLDAELLLRSLGVRRGADEYLAAARRRADEPDEILEDEGPEACRHHERRELAVRCRSVLERFFAAWPAAPERGPWADHFGWLRELAGRLGLDGEGALQPLWDELDGWAIRERRSTVKRKEFLEVVGTLTATAGQTTEALPKIGVRVVPAELAAGLPCDHLFLLGLGERGFPQAASSGGLYPEARRQQFQAAGLDLSVAGEQLPREMLLFYRLLCGARQSVTLSYAAVDEAGQELLPGSFWQHVVALFDTIPTTRRRMLLEGLHDDQPLCPAEYRVRYAATNGDISALSAALRAHLRAAKAVAASRFQNRAVGRFDGFLSDFEVRQTVAERFGPAAVFAPTSLEDYITCPFKFFMSRVLNLAPLDEPTEEIEGHRRGAAYHRALRRTHDEALRTPGRTHGEMLAEHLRGAAGEYADRAASPALKMLWRLEGERLSRNAGRYDTQLQQFRGPKSGAAGSAPLRFEENLSVTVDHDGQVVRLAGRIDRMDVQVLADGTTGFWVIDYKTGRSTYSSAEVARLARVQLPVYALAAEEKFSGRPLGLLYWLPAGKGPVYALPKKSTDWITQDGWPAVRDRLRQWLAGLVRRIRAGEFPLRPRSEDCTASCDFGQVCRITQCRGVEKDWELPLPVGETEAD